MVSCIASSVIMRATYLWLLSCCCCAFLNLQAYPGCEHSPEYTQLLYTTALNRLDLFSPTAAPSSALWLMHVDKAAAAAAGAVAAAVPQAAAKPQQQWSLAGVEQTALAAGAAADAADKAAAAPATAPAGAAAFPAAQPAQQQQPCTIRQTSSANSLVLNNELLLEGDTACGSAWEQQQQQQSGLELQPQQVPAVQLPLLGASLQQQQQQQEQQLPPLAPLQQQQSALLGSQHLLDPGDGVQQQQQQQQQQQGLTVDQPLPPPPPPAAATAAAAAAGGAGGADVPALLDDELSEDFFNDLLAIFDEAEGLQADTAPDVTGAAATAAAAAGAAAACQPAGEAVAGKAIAVDKLAPATQQPQQQQQQQRPAMAVPLAVKAGVVFMLHCLHDTQLNLPPAAIYTSLQHLQLLQQAAVQLSAAGAGGADALGVLQLLLTQHRLLVGQFRRPVHWVPQLPAWLAPPKPRYPDLGLGLLAANRAAARAHNGARVAAVHAAANAARSLRAIPRSVDPVVHREALFHIKTALRSLANFRSLQALCSKYAGARQAIFEPLLRIKEPLGDQQQQQQQQEHQKQTQESQQQQDQQQQQGRKRGGKGKPNSANKRSKQQSDSQDDAWSQKYMQLLQEQQQREKRQQQAAAAAEAARAAGIPELFDRNFGLNLSQLAGDEAAQMLVLLDPSKNPGYVRQMLNKQQQALEAAEAAEKAAASRDGGAHLRGLAGDAQQQRTKAGSTKAAARRAGPAAPAAMLRQQQQQQQQGWQYLQELCAVGVLHPAELQELQEDESEGSVHGLGAAAQVLQLQRQRRQHTLVLAEQWFRSHDAMLMQADDDEDMP
jgi:hypothetical protein